MSCDRKIRADLTGCEATSTSSDMFVALLRTAGKLVHAFGTISVPLSNQRVTYIAHLPAICLLHVSLRLVDSLAEVAANSDMAAIVRCLGI